MQLPNLANAVIEEKKITSYLLAEERPEGKAAFFLAVGFTRARWDLLQGALLAHAGSNEVVGKVTNPHGVKYIIEGPVQTPDGRNPPIRAVWIVDKATDVPRLVTAYPLEKEK